MLKKGFYRRFCCTITVHEVGSPCLPRCVLRHSRIVNVKNRNLPMLKKVSRGYDRIEAPLNQKSCSNHVTSLLDLETVCICPLGRQSQLSPTYYFAILSGSCHEVAFCFRTHLHAPPHCSPAAVLVCVKKTDCNCIFLQIVSILSLLTKFGAIDSLVANKILFIIGKLQSACKHSGRSARRPCLTEYSRFVYVSQEFH